MTLPSTESPPAAPRKPIQRARLAVLFTVFVLALMALLVGAARFGPETATGRRLIERQVSGLTVGRFGLLSVEGLAGDPWSDFRVERLTLADRQGVWLDVRGLAVAWRPSALLERRVRVTSATARSVALVRRPVLTPSHKAKPGVVAIQIDRLTARLELTAAAAYRRGVYDFSGRVDAERSGAMRGALSASSVLHTGDFLAAMWNIDHAKAFAVTADAREAQGGALAGMAGLRTDLPFLFSVRAAGSIKAGQINIDTKVGPAAPFEANASWTQAGGSAHGTVVLAASRWLASYQKMVGPVARFDVTGHKAVDGLFDLAVALRGDNFTFNAAGEADVGRMLTGPRGVAIAARMTDPTQMITFPKMGAAQVRAVLGGDAEHWVLAGDANADQVAGGDFRLSKLSGPFRLESRGGNLTIQVTAAGEGGAGGGLAAALLGARPRGSAALTLFANGRLLMRDLSLQGAGLKVNATGERGLLGGLTFRGTAAFSNLAFAHAGAKGAVNAAWTATQGAAKDPWSFTADARGVSLAAGFGEVDRLLGPTPRLDVRATLAGATISVASANLQGAAASVSAAGVIGPASTLALKLSWRAQGPFAVGPVEIDGAAKGSGDVTGAVTAPRADILAEFSKVDLPSLPLRDAHLVLTFAAGPDGTDGQVGLTATSDYGAAQAHGDFRFVRAGLDLSGVIVRGGGVSAEGALSLRDGEPSSADFDVTVGPGAFLNEGKAAGKVKLVAAGGPPHATLSILAEDAVLRRGGVKAKSFKLSADGPLSRLPYHISAAGSALSGPWRLAGDGVFAEDHADRTVTFIGTGHVRRADIRTLAPLEAHFSSSGLTARATLAIGAGRANIDYASHAGALTAKAEVSGLGLVLLDPDMVGQVDGTIVLAGRGDHLTGDLKAQLAGAGGRDLKGSPPVNGTISARLTAGAVEVHAQFANSQGLKATGDATLPAESSAAPFRIALNNRKPISGRFAVDGELKPLFELVMGGSQSLSGRVTASGTIAGTLADPRAVGTAALDDGHFQDSDTGLKLSNIILRATMADDAVDVGQFSATDGARGTVEGSGRASLARDGASSFSVDLKGFRLIDNDLAQATASGRVTVNRAANGKVQLSGAVVVDRAQISPNPPVATGVVPMEVVEVHKPDMTDERFAAAPPATRDAPLGLDVSVKAPNGVFVKGRGLNLELSLDAHVGGSTESPLLTGAARVVRGDYDFAGQRFQFDDRGVIYLGSTAETIRLNLTATRDDPALTAVIKIAGTAAKPSITLSSSPVLPQDEILSQVLFGASAAQLSGLQAAQLASALAGLSGGGGFDLIGGLRSFAHLDRLSIGGTTATGTTVSGGKYITDRIYLELTGGTREGQEASLEWRLKKHLSLVSKLGTQGDSQVSIRWRKDY